MSDEVQATEFTVSRGAPVVRIVKVGTEEPALAEEQLSYAGLLDIGMKLGLLLLVVTFGLYVFGVLSPHLAVEDLPKYWSLPVRDYLAATGIHPGWQWVHMLGRGDFLNFTGIAFLSGVTILCYLAIIPIFLRKKDKIYGLLSVIEVIVLALAASGLLNVGAH